jgi:tRNA pseudouridine38-40 synthase
MPESVQAVPHTWRLTLAYDGTDYQGWQVQPGARTIQGELQSALGRVTGEAPLPQGSGRTDAGVHALAQVASFALMAPIPPENLWRALNRTLPCSIRVLDAKIMPGSFHARHSAIAKTYEYRVWPRQPGNPDICSPFAARYVFCYPWELKTELLEKAACCFEGEHDFLSFAASDPDWTTRTTSSQDDAAATTIRTISCSTWEARRAEFGDLLVYRVRGNGFLHHMVRNLVGTMLDVGRGQLDVHALPGILGARARAQAGPTAPARGLFLHSVEYPDDDRL